MVNALYLALITAIYAAILIISSVYVKGSMKFFSDSKWSEFIIQGNLKFVGLCMIAIVILIDLFSALSLKRFDEYHTSILSKNLIFNGIVAVLLFPIAIGVLVAAPIYFAETVFALMIFQWFVIVAIAIIYLIKSI
jgi:hypothetical protein